MFDTECIDILIESELAIVKVSTEIGAVDGEALRECFERDVGIEKKLALFAYCDEFLLYKIIGVLDWKKGSCYPRPNTERHTKYALVRAKTDLE